MKILVFLSLLMFSLQASALVVLQYHHVSDKTPRATSISPKLFEQHLAYLEEAKFRIVDMRDLKRWLEKGEPLPNRSAVITFDDGFKSIYSTAFPLLKKRGWPFTVFVNTQAHDSKNPQYASWAQLKEMDKAGAFIANHSDSHPHMIRQQAYESRQAWLSRREQEILFAEKRIKKQIGESVKAFAYPFGEHDEELRRFLKSQGYIAFGQQSGPVSGDANLQNLPRFPFGGTYGGMEDFAQKVNSMPFPQARIKVTKEDGSVLVDPELPRGVSRPVLRVASPLMRFAEGMACYASGQGVIYSEVKGGVLVAKAKRDLPVGRSRYNCTAQAGGGRYYWYSHMFIRRAPDGEWAHE